MTIATYLLAIIAANLAIAAAGPAAAVPVAFLFIGLDLVLRDRLHDAWAGRGLLPRMAALIAAGGALSYLANADAGRVALASTAAFAAAAAVDTVAYHLLRHLPFQARANGSNVPAAVADSLIFPAVAFGGLLWPVVIGQLIAKTAGGALWAWAIAAHRRRIVPTR